MTDPPAFAVAIPAHDEARTIGRALDAVFVAAAGTRPVVVVVAADACRDRTAAAVRARARHAPANVSVDVVEVQLRSAGAARHVAAAAAVRRLPPSVTTGAGCWLATTDADSTVPVDWLDGLRTWARRGADAVAGLVRVDARARLVPEVRRTVEGEYEASRLGHAHVYGANLGVSVAWWARVGGFPRIDTGEDRLFVERLRAAGARVVAADDSVVLTSGRLTARAPNGFGARLAHLTAAAMSDA